MHKKEDDWVSACRTLNVVRIKGGAEARGLGENVDMKLVKEGSGHFDRMMYRANV